MRTPIALAVLALVAGWAVTSAAQQDEPRAELTPEVRVAEGPHGPHLVDVKGRPLYRFEADRRATGEQLPESRCSDECLARWPPLVSRGDARAGSEAVRDPLLGSFVRKSGVRQVTYDGWPLYYYAADEEDRITGHGVHDAGGEWLLMRPKGGPAAEGR